PELARSAGAAYAPLLGHLSATLRERLGNPELLALSTPSMEHRARLLRALHAWFLQVATQTPLLLCVDNLHAIDESSAAFLAAIGQVARNSAILTLSSLRSREHAHSPAPVRTMRQRSARIKLGPLSADHCAALVASLFGDVPNSQRLAAVVYERSAGNPRQCMDLVQLLAKKEIVKYSGGTWVLPLDVSTEALPVDVGELTGARVAALSDSALRLAEALSIERRPMPIAHCRALAGNLDDSEFYFALDELIAEQILLTDGTNYRFAQEATRDAIARRMPAEMRNAAHVRAARAALEGAHQDVAARMQAGFHYLQAGDELRGADLLAGVGNAFLAERCATAGSEQAVSALVLALEGYDRLGRSSYEVARVLFPLVPLAYFSDWRVLMKHADRTLAVGLDITGLALAKKLRPLLGEKLALMAGMGVAALRFERRKKRGLEYGLIDAIGRFCAALPAVAGVFGTTLNVQRQRELLKQIEPLSYFGSKEFPRLMYDLLQANISAQGGPGAYAALQGIRERFHDPKIKSLLGDAYWKAMYGGVPFQLGLQEVFMLGDLALARAEELDALGVPSWSLVADYLRLLHYALRGEAEKMRSYAARVELAAVQGGTTWQAEMFYPVLLFPPQVLEEDTIGVRRTWEQLARLAQEVPSLRQHAAAAHAAYLTLRGHTREAIAEYERLLPDFPMWGCTNWDAVHAHYMRALNKDGQHTRAKEVGVSIAAVAREDQYTWASTFECFRQRAIAEAG
ncbi:MAG TPA: hypothetical protein VK524_12355, partial [Polyangiaceae bacterium]|nr:hypothetical protein [Polyangiaceae bacterium]